MPNCYINHHYSATLMDIKDAEALSTLVWSLNVIGKIGVNERLDCTASTVVKLDDSINAWLWRVLQRDSRSQTVTWLTTTYSELVRLLNHDVVAHSFETTHVLLRCTIISVSGLRNLAELYKDDTPVHNKIQHILHETCNLALNILVNNTGAAQKFVAYTSDDHKFNALRRAHIPPPPPPQEKKSTQSEPHTEEEQPKKS